MNKKELLQLIKLGTLKPDQIKKQQPKLYREISTKASDSLKARVRKKLKNAPKEIKARFEKIDFSPEKLGNTDIKALLEKDIIDSNINASRKKELLASLNQVDSLGKLDNDLLPQVPTFLNPVLEKDIKRAKLHLINDAAGISEAKSNAIFEKGVDIENIDANRLDALVKGQIITSKEADNLGLAANIHTLVDGNFELSGFIGAKVKPKDLSELVGTDNEKWASWIRESKMEMPAGMKTEDYAAFLKDKVHNIYPEKALEQNVLTIKRKEISNNAKNVKVLFKKNDLVFGVQSFDSLNSSGISESELEKVKGSYTKLNQIVRSYPGLGFDKILNDKNLSPAQMEEQFQARKNSYDKFIKQNKDIHYLSLDYKHDSKDIERLNFQGINKSDQSLILRNIRSQQRVYSITKNAEDTHKLLQAGFTSSFHVTSMTFDEFASASGLEQAVAKTYFDNAHANFTRTTGLIGSVLDAVAGSFDWTAVGNTGPNIQDYLRDIPGYQDLFGALSHCECEHCQSIYSPAAYFVDLMQFVEQYVLNKEFTGTKESHVLNLKVRRPDLWTLELSCENTNTLIPYLDIINEILETYIAKEKGFTGNLADRAAVGNFIYKTEIALEKGSWKNFVNASNEPFHLPLCSVETYLLHFEKSREEIARILDRPLSEISRAKFSFSNKELILVSQKDVNQSFLKRVYGINFVNAGSKIKPFDAQDLLKALYLTRDELGYLLETEYATNSGALNILIKSEKKDSSSIQNDIERIRNLNYSALDRIHRFIRLWRKTSLSIIELDICLTYMKSMGIASDINEDAITALGIWLYIKEELNLTLEEVLGVVNLISTKVIGSASKSHFDRLFNHEDIVATQGSYPKNSTKLVHPALAISQTATNTEFSSTRISAALNRSDEEVLVLIKNLASPLGISSLTSTNESNRGFLLTRSNLTLLYRHSKVASSLSLSIQELFNLISLSSEIADGHLKNSADLIKLIELHEWWNSTNVSIEELHYLLDTGAIQDLSAYPDTAQLAEELVMQVNDGNQLFFADTVFSFIDGISEEKSREVILENSNFIELSPDGTNYWLKNNYNESSTLNLPADISDKLVEIKATLKLYHPTYLIPFHLSSTFALSESSISALTNALGINLDLAVFTRELQMENTPATKIAELIGKLSKYDILFDDNKFDDSVIQFVIDNNSVFGIADFNNLTLKSIRLVSILKSFITTDDLGQNNIESLNSVISAYSSTNQYSNADQEVIASILEVEEESISSIHSLAGSFNGALRALEFYREVAHLCSYIGIDPSSLNKILSYDYDVLNEANTEILGAFQSKYINEEERQEKLETYQDMIRGKKRTSLTTYLIRSGFPQFKDTNDLYHYFLIDTELEGCARTSRLVAATMSLQLYVHRILLNLEQDDKAPGSSNRIYVRPSCIPEDEWEWRKNYRVWEANRKVFLYPENYIEPDLRDNKTPLFEELEKDLLQQEINEDTVLEAYGKYMRGFDELAHLKIAGAYHEKDNGTETDALHLFGVTANDPPMFYYRRVDNLYFSEQREDRGVVWNPWQKINVQIPVRKVSPIVYNGRLHVFWTKITTLANTVFDENRSLFVGYSHKVIIEFTTLNLDGTWTTPQKLSLKDSFPFDGTGVIQDPLADRHEVDEFTGALHDALRSFPFFDWSQVSTAITNLKTPRYALEAHYEAKDEYSLQGFLWDRIYPYVDSSGRLVLTGAGFQMRAVVDFYNLTVQGTGSPISDFTHDPVRESITIVKEKAGKLVKKEGNLLFRAISPSVQKFDNFAYSSLLVNATKTDALLNRLWADSTLDSSFDSIKQERIATVSADSDIQIVNGAYSDTIIDASGDLMILQGEPIDGNGFVMKRIGTTISETLTRTLFTSGVSTAIGIETQKTLKEARTPHNLSSSVVDKVTADAIDWKGAFGTYYREIFFHIPFLLANHLNSQGKYAEAQKWYHYIFNPGADEVINFPSGATVAEKKKMELDRNWQYLEFREINVQKLRDQLNNKAAIEAYKKDPFNPHAIARLRLSAYQKSIVMKYIDNLLDWGDQLFTMDTMESINEATLLYIIAKEIMGDRPVEIGSCDEGVVSPKNYETIKPLLNKGSEFLAEIETYSAVRTPGRKVFAGGKRIRDRKVIEHAGRKALRRVPKAKTQAFRIMSNSFTLSENKELRKLGKERSKNVTVPVKNDAITGKYAVGTVRGVEWKKDSIYARYKNRVPSFGWSLVKHVSPVFCVPGNKNLYDYYDRVDDRLYKIRNCMNILGEKRQLALFAPEIDPMFLVRARAAGLSMDDILNSLSGNLPPYRFSYILDRAKGFVSTVQSLGSALLGAIERRDSEELAMIRMTNQQNILEMTTKSRELEIETAEKGINSTKDRIASLDYQISHYNMLIDERTNPWEVAQQIGKHSASIIKGTEATISFAAGILYLIPQLGSPFAMKYGGAELGANLSAFAFAMNGLADLGENLASSAGLEAGFDRRSQRWEHQKTVLEFEKSQAEKSLTASEIRRDILIESLAIHQKNIEQNQEVMDFFGEKFSNLGLFTWLSSTLQQLYKEAYNNAMAIVKLAEQAYKFERDDDTIFVESNYYDSSKAGLLAGNKLMLALQTMERKYLETNYRKMEINQAFSLTQIDPSALIDLKQTGQCEFSIPEVYYDLFYPGQYRRKIKAVQLTIPSVTGPYTNVSANLSLMSSFIRMKPKLGSVELKEVPKSRTTNIATSTAQSDAGVFQLNFRDERYMPFEGAGAVSSWKLSLPKTFKQFDYNTINDVILNISYEAEYDELYRDKVEEQNDAIEGTLANVLKNNAISRTLSLRQEFSVDFNRLMELPTGNEISVSIHNKHFPMFLNGKTLNISAAKLILVTPKEQSVGAFNIAIKDVNQTGFSQDASLGNLFVKDLGSVFNSGIIGDHTFKIVSSGDLGVPPSGVGPTPALDKEKLIDMVLHIEYTVEA